MINQQISFWDVSKTSLGYLSAQLDKMDILSHESSHLFKAFEKAQKTYLNSCKKLVNMTKDGMIEKSQVKSQLQQNFISPRKQYQQQIENTALGISDVFFSMPSQKCYFSVQLSHGLYTRLTFPYLPGFFNKYCNKEKQDSKHIFKTLLKFDQPEEFQVSVLDQKITLENKDYKITLEFFAGIFYFSTFTPLLPELVDKINLLFRVNPSFMKNQCNKIGELIKDVQKEEYFLTYICYFFNNTIRQIQYQIALLTLDGIYRRQLSVSIHESIADFISKIQTHIIYKQQFKLNYSDIIIKSKDKFYIQLQQSFEIPEQTKIQWNIQESLEKKLSEFFQSEKLKADCIQFMRQKNRTLPTYFPVPFQMDHFSHEDQQIHNIFTETNCSSFFKCHPFIFTFEKESILLWQEKQNKISKISLTYFDQNQLTQLFQDNLEIFDYLRWVIVRNCALNINQKLAKIRISDSEIKFTQKIKDSPLITTLNQNGLNFLQRQIPLQELLPSFEEFDCCQIRDLIQNKLIECKFFQIQQQYPSF